MYKRAAQRGTALLLILAIILLVVILANAILSLVSSQSRLANHQVRRIQAYYASMAGINYAMEQLRLGNWAESGDPYKICKGGGCDVQEPDLPPYIDTIDIFITKEPATSANNPDRWRIESKVNFAATF